MFTVLRKGRNRLRVLACALATGALAACEPVAFGGAGLGGPSIDANAPVPVALLVPRGGSSSDDILADNLEKAAQLAIRDLDGVTVDLRVYSTAGNAATAANVATQAVNEGAKIILGPVYGEAANAAGVAVSSSGINVLSFSNNVTIAGGNVFVLGPTFDNTASRMMGYAKRQGRDRVVVVHAQDVAGQLGRDAVVKAISNQRASLAGTVDYALSQDSVVSAVPRVKSAVESSGANAVFLTAPSAGALPLFAQLLPENGIRTETTQFIGLTRWDIPPQTLSLSGVQGGWFAIPDPNATAAFRQKFIAAYGLTPHPLAGLAFDGIAAVGALAQSGNSDALTRGVLTQGAGFRGASGIFRLHLDGTNERGLAVATIQNQSVQILEGAPQAFGGVGF